MELVAASKDEEGAAGRPAGRGYAGLMAEMLAAVAGRVEESQHPFLTRREVKTRGIILVTTDKGLCGPLNANLFKLVTEIKGPRNTPSSAARAPSSSPAPSATCSPTSP